MSDTFPKSPRGLTDAGSARDAHEHERQVCARRLPGAVYCTRPESHEGPCIGPAARELERNTFGPEQALKRGWGR